MFCVPTSRTRQTNDLAWPSGPDQELRALTSALADRASTLLLMGRAAEAAGDARRALALAREIGYPAGELQALVDLSLDAHYAGDHDEAVRLARQAGQITAGIPGPAARMYSYLLTIVLAGAGNLAEAECVGAAAWPGPGTRATCGPRRSCCPGSWRWTCGRAAPATPRRTCGKRSASRCGPAVGLR